MAFTRGIVQVGCAAAVAFGSVVTASPAAAKECPWGTSETRFEGVCSPSSTQGGAVVVAPPVGGANIVYPPGELPRVNGVPCTPEKWGTCYGMAQNG